MAKRIRYEFAWTDGSRISARFSAKVFGPIIVRYLKLYKQKLAAEKLLLEATSAGSELHYIFDWDDESAAHQHRLFQSRHLLRALDYKFKIKGGGELRGRATTISERNLHPGKFYYSMLKPAQVLKEAEDDCSRSVEKIVSQLDRIVKKYPQILQECRQVLWNRICEVYSIDEIAAEVRRQLKARTAHGSATGTVRAKRERAVTENKRRKSK